MAEKPLPIRVLRVGGKAHVVLRVLIVLACLGMSLVSAPYTCFAEPETVILLHGYGRTSYSMLPLQYRLESEGFHVHNFGYPSMRSSPQELTGLLAREIDACCSNSPRMHFVTHSLGGILVRAYLAGNRMPNMGRVVMLAPPNQGSELADMINGSSLLSTILGSTVIQLGTGAESLPNRLPSPWFEIGVIAGVDEFNPLGDWFVPKPSDGTVSVASTRLDGMHDFVTVPKSHTFIMWSGEVADYVVRFLRTGRFQEIATLYPHPAQ